MKSRSQSRKRFNDIQQPTINKIMAMALSDPCCSSISHFDFSKYFQSATMLGIKWKTILKVLYYQMKLEQRIFHNSFPMKVFFFLIATFLITTHQSEHISFEYGLTTARVAGENGRIPISCYGGSGEYQFTFENLPKGWSAQGNELIVPGIGTVRGSYTVDISVKDSEGNTGIEMIGLRIHGKEVLIETGSNINRVNKASNVLNEEDLQGIEMTAAGSKFEAASSIDIGSLNTIPTQKLQEAERERDIQQIIANERVISQEMENSGLSHDEKMASILNRQMNANKLVGSLYKKVEELTTCVNAEKSEIIIADNAVKNAEALNKRCNMNLLNLRGERDRVSIKMKESQKNMTHEEKEYKNLTLISEQIKGILKNKTLSKEDLIKDRIKLEKSPELTILQSWLSECKQEKETTVKQSDALESEINVLNLKIKMRKQEIEDAPTILKNIAKQIPVVEKKIADLEKQLNSLKTSRESLVGDQKKYEELVKSGDKDTEQLEKQKIEVEKKIDYAVFESEKISRQCEIIGSKVKDFQAKNQKKDADFKKLLDLLEVEIESVQRQYEKMDKKVQECLKKYNSSKKLYEDCEKKYIEIEEGIKRQSEMIESSSKTLQEAIKNLQARNLKLASESQWLREATSELEKARIQKDLADAAVNKMIGGAKPSKFYNTARKRLDMAAMGGTHSNNLRKTEETSISKSNPNPNPNSIFIGDLENYLLQAYRIKIKLEKPVTDARLFKLNPKTLEALSGKSKGGEINPSEEKSKLVTKRTVTVSKGEKMETYLDNFDCSSPKAIIQGIATVEGIQAGLITLKDEKEQKVTIKVGECSNLESIYENYSLSQNDKVIFKVEIDGKKQLNLLSLTYI